MKRRMFGGGGGGRWKRGRVAETGTAAARETAEDEQPLLKGMKLEAADGGGDLINDGANNEEDTLTPMVLSLLNQHHQNGTASANGNNVVVEANANNNAGGQRGDSSSSIFSLMNLRTVAEREPRDKLFNAQLIQEVSRHPALYDFTTEEYKNIEARNRHWQEVSESVEQPLEFVRTRWKTLRDRFKKEVRRVQANQPGIVWQHYEGMIYLLPFVRDKLEEVVYGATASSMEGGGGTSASTTMMTTRQQQKQHQMLNGANGTKDGLGMGSAATNNAIAHSTAAILDLAMCAVNKFSPPGTSASPPSSSTEFGGLIEHFGGGGTANGGVEEFLVGANSIGASGATAIINSAGGSQMRGNFHQAEQQNNKGGGGGGGGGGWIGGGGMGGETMASDADEEDQLFCRIVLKKLGKLEDRTKERAKAKIMEMLVEMQYGGGGGGMD